jgi:hypothetical protein
VESINKISKIAGAGYLIIFISGIFANFFVLEGLVVPGDAKATVANIAANTQQFRIGILSFIVMVIFDVVVSWALYLLLKPVNKDLSLLAAWLRLVNATIFGVALYHLLNVLHFTSGGYSLAIFDAGQLQAQVMLSFDAFNTTWLVGLVFFGLHLFFLGYLILKSSYLPSVIGVLLMVASVGYLTDSFANFLMPGYTAYKTIFMTIVIVPGVIGELSLAMWLLIKGARVPA